MRIVRWISGAKLRLTALVRPQELEHDLDDELAFHLEMQVQANVAEGMSERDARIRARAQLGVPALSMKDACRDQRNWHWLESLLQDLRYAVRGLRRAPAFALT